MVREIITLSIGECGVRFGSKIWETYTTEHHLDSNGVSQEKKPNSINLDSFFAERENGAYTARSILCDSSLYNMEYGRNSHIHSLHNPINTVAPKEDCSNLYSRGAYTTGKASLDHLQHMLRKMADDCDNPQGFIVNHSITGGTSSGLTAPLLDQIRIDFRRKCRFGIEVCPSVTYNGTNSICDPYNMILSMHELLDHTDVSLMFDNEALYNLCRNKLNVFYPSYDHVNELIAKTVTHFTQDLRFTHDVFDHDMNSMVSDNVPFPRLHFLTPSIATIAPKYNPLMLIDGYVRSAMEREYIYEDVMCLLYASYDVNKTCADNIDPLHLTRNAFNPNNFLMHYGDFNVLEDKYMGCRVQYRGDCMNKKTYDFRVLQNIIRQVTRFEQEHMKHVEWVPTYCKFGVVDQHEIGMKKKSDDILADNESSAVMIGNNTAFGRWCRRRILNKFNVMFDRRAYVHWYYNEGMEEDCFTEARADLEYLTEDYKDVLEEQDTDEDTDEEDLTYNRTDYVISTMSEQQMIDRALKDSLEDWKSNVADLSS